MRALAHWNVWWRDEKRRHLLVSLNYSSLDSWKRIFLSYCFFTKTKRNHTNQTFEMSRLVTCAVFPFGQMFFFFLHKRCFIYTTSRPQYESCTLRRPLDAKVPSINIFMTVVHHKLLLYRFDFIFCLIFVFIHTNKSTSQN